MSWDYLWKAGPKGGSLVSLSDYATDIRVATVFVPGRRGANPTALYKHGSVPLPRKWGKDLNVVLETVIRYTNAAGVVTHVDGAEGHVFENKASLAELLGGEQGKLVTLQQDAPDHGVIEIDVEMLGDAAPTQQRHVYGWPLRAPSPYWRSSTQRTGLTPATGVTVNGTAPVDDFVLHLAGGTDAKIVHDGSGAYIQFEGATPGPGIDIDLDAGTVLSGSTDYRAKLKVLEPWWMELDPGANAFTITGGGTWTIDLYDKWR